MAELYKTPKVIFNTFVSFFFWGKVLDENKHLILLGHFNIDLLENTTNTSEYLNCIASNEFHILNHLNSRIYTQLSYRNIDCIK